MKIIDLRSDTVTKPSRAMLEFMMNAEVGDDVVGEDPTVKKLEARRWRKVLGGGMRQAGIMAAAGIYALEHNIARLSDDHDNAAYLAAALSEIEEINVEPDSLQTNMFFIKVRKNYSELQLFLETKGIKLPKQPNKYGTIRLVTHLDVSRKDLLKVLQEIKVFYRPVILTRKAESR